MLNETTVIQNKSKAFAVRVIKLYEFIVTTKKDFVIGRQILDSGTSIGANLAEAKYAVSNKDFLYKLQISLKEASETAYWLELLMAANYLSQKEFDSIYADCIELIRILTAIVKTIKEKDS